MEKYVVIEYQMNKKDSLQNIYKKFTKDNVKILNSDSAFKKTLKNNRHILNGDKIPKGEFIRFYVLTQDLDVKKYEKIKQIKRAEFENFFGIIPSNGFKSSIYYTYFYGKLNQSNGSQNVDFTQKGLLTLGGQGNLYFKDSLHSLGMGLSGSKIETATSNFNLGQVHLPREFNSYLYGEYRFRENKPTLHYGIDYEKFSSIHLSESKDLQKVVLENNSIIYASVGISAPLSVLRTSLFTKLIVSKSLSSTSTLGHSYQGFKTSMTMNIKINKLAYVMSSIKYQHLSDQDDIEMLRVGLGFGLMF
jgi:hypothetical protein